MKQPDRGTERDVRQWIAKAEEDFGIAQFVISRKGPFHGPLSFHAQQCAEKYLKAFLVHRRVDFPKTHDIDLLLDLIEGIDRGLAEACETAGALTPYAVEARYWVDAEEVTLDEARRAVDLASKVREAVCEALREFLGGEAPKGTDKP